MKLRRITANFTNFNTSRVRGVARINKLILVAVLAVAAVFAASRIGSTQSSAQVSGRLSVTHPRDTFEVGREFSFPVRDSEDNIVGHLKLKIEEAELRDELIINGEVARSVKGRTFLIINLKVTNDLDRALRSVPLLSYLRLSVNGAEGERAAPGIHSLGEERVLRVDPISTKETRVGFPVNETDRDFVLFVGEVNGEKERLELDLSYN